jgi:hypothetical protein
MAELALDGSEDAALLTGDEDATGILGLVDIGPLDRKPVSVSVSSMTCRRV